MDINVAFIKTLNCVVTGYKGYIGSSLLARFKPEDVIISNLYNFKNAKTVIHLASKISESNHSVLQHNIDLDLNMFEFCKINNSRLIYASTNNVYPKQENCHIGTPTMIVDYYNASKIIAEQLLTSIYKNNSILRIGDVFGLNQRHGNFFKALEQAIKKDTSLIQYGNGIKIRNYIYIEDLVNVIEHLLSHQCEQQILNIAYSQPYSIKQIINFISHLSGLPIEYKEYAEVADTRTLISSLPKNFSYQYTMETALKKYVNAITCSKVCTA